MSEIWCRIPDFVDYEVSSFGRVRSLTRTIEYPTYTKVITGTIIQLRADSKKRYLLVSLYRNKTPYTRLVHRLVWAAFRGNVNGREINHINGLKTDNRLENLEAVSHSENERHKYAILGYRGPAAGKSGALHCRSKTVEQIDLTTGKVIATYGSIREAERATRALNSCISLCCQGKQRKAAGYGWRYKKTQE